MQDMDPGAHGADVAGTHGCGVNTPSAAAVAAATAGFERETHIAKGMMFVMGILSITVAAGIVAITLFAGSTAIAPGAVPKEQLSCAPAATDKPTCLPPHRNTPRP
jgi:hypothetical protein